MPPNSFVKAWGTLLLAALLVLLFPLLYPFFGETASQWRTYHFPTSLFQSIKGEISRDSAASSGQSEADLPPAYRGVEHLHSFYQSLQQDSGQIRIGYMGDSAIEGDLITQTLRDSLQNLFGGSGVGLLPLTSHIQTFRRSVRHQASDGWYRRMIGQSNTLNYPLGILGGYFLTRSPLPRPDTLLSADSLAIPDTLALSPADTASPAPVWVSYGGVSLYPGLEQLPRVRLFYGPPIPDSTEQIKTGSLWATSGSWEAAFLLTGNQSVNHLWISKTPLRRVQLTFEVAGKQPLYAVSAESEAGVIVDNIPSRGNSGGRLTQIPRHRLQAFNAWLDYELIILQFGLNALAPEVEDFTWYRQEIRRALRHIKRAFPEAPILLIGPTDRGIKVDGSFQSDPSVPRVTAVMREVAEAEQVSFFSFYEAMGGPGSMIEWVEQRQPRWANLDYTHLSFIGAEKAGVLLLEFLLGGYKTYLQQQRQTEQKDL